MNLYLLHRPSSWDETRAMLVRASSPSRARELAVAARTRETLLVSSTESAAEWARPRKTTVVMLGVADNPAEGVVLAAAHSSELFTHSEAP